MRKILQSSNAVKKYTKCSPYWQPSWCKSFSPRLIFSVDEQKWKQSVIHWLTKSLIEAWFPVGFYRKSLDSLSCSLTKNISCNSKLRIIKGKISLGAQMNNFFSILFFPLAQLSYTIFFINFQNSLKVTHFLEYLFSDSFVRK